MIWTDKRRVNVLIWTDGRDGRLNPEEPSCFRLVTIGFRGVELTFCKLAYRGLYFGQRGRTNKGSKVARAIQDAVFGSARKIQ
jgi:hypothetical protein